MRRSPSVSSAGHRSTSGRNVGNPDGGLMGPRGKPPRTEMTEAARKRWTLIAAIIGLNITILDETVVFLALPAINRDLHVSLNGQEWIVNAYLLSLSALPLLGGSLADLFGRRRLFLYG